MKTFRERWDEFSETDRKVFKGMIAALIILLLILPFAAAAEKEQEIANAEYISVTVDELDELLDSNPALASETYVDQYVAITGRVSTIDSDMEYIELCSATNTYDLLGVHCLITDKENIKESLLQLSIDDIVIVKGKVTSVGDILGYYVDVIEITKDE